MLHYLPAEIAASYYVKNRKQCSFLSCFSTLKQNGRSYIHVQKVTRHDGSRGAYITGNTFEVHIITPARRFVRTGKNCARGFEYGTRYQAAQRAVLKTSSNSVA